MQLSDLIMEARNLPLATWIAGFIIIRLYFEVKR